MSTSSELVGYYSQRWEQQYGRRDIHLREDGTVVAITHLGAPPDHVTDAFCVGEVGCHIQTVQWGTPLTRWRDRVIP